LKSRKARLVGEWKLSEGSITATDGADVLNYSYDGNTCVVSGAANGSWAYTQDVSFKKDGTFTISLFEDGDRTVFEGNWYFLGANKEGELKNKEAVNLVYTKITDTPAGGVPSTITASGFFNNGLYNGIGATYRIDRLSNKEIVLLVDWSLTSTSTSSRKGTLTFTE
jgi:hypothetical protein